MSNSVTDLSVIGANLNYDGTYYHDELAIGPCIRKDSPLRSFQEEDSNFIFGLPNRTAYYEQERMVVIREHFLRYLRKLNVFRPQFTSFSVILVS